MTKETARWIKHTHLFRKDEYVCSACKAVSAKPYKVCPECGHRMRGAKADAGWVDEMEALDAFLED